MTITKFSTLINSLLLDYDLDRVYLSVVLIITLYFPNSVFHYPGHKLVRNITALFRVEGTQSWLQIPC